MCSIVRTLTDRAVVAELDPAVGVIPLVVATVLVRLPGDTEVDQKPGQPSAYLRTASEPTGRLHHRRNLQRFTSRHDRPARPKPTDPTATALTVTYAA